MTHDLFKSFAQSFKFSVSEIIISDLKEGVFYAKIVCSDGIKKVDIDARPSDAIAIGLRFNVPIYTFETILSEAGIVFTESQEEEEPLIKKEESSRQSPSAPEKFKDVPFEKLKEMLDEALENEDYEKAARIRDELNKRN